MLENILNAIQGPVMNIINNNTAIPDEKKEQAVTETTQTVAQGLKQNVSSGNISSLMSLFSGSSSSLSTNPVVNNIEAMVINTLVQKIGLPQGVANTVASSIVSAVAGALSNKVQDPNEKGFNVQSILKAFGGGDSSNTNNPEEKGNDILDTIGNFFKK